MTTTTTTTTHRCTLVSHVTRIPVSLNDPAYFCNKSWTVSYNMNTKSWISFHSYIPNFYIGENNFFYSGINGCCEDFDFIATTIGTSTTTTSTTAPPTTTTTSTSTTSTSTTSTTSTSTTSSTTSTTSTTTTVYQCRRPEGLTNFQLATGYEIVSPPVTFVSTGSQEEACSAEDYILNYGNDPPVTVSVLQAQGVSISVGQILYSGWIDTDCTLVPDGWYFTEDMMYVHLVFHVVNGIIVEITSCSTTTTTSTSSTTTTTTTTIIPGDCGNEISYQSGDVYENIYSITLGSATGTVLFYFEADVVPDRYIIVWNGTQVIDTGYHGSIDYDFGGVNRSVFIYGLTGRTDPVTTNVYPDYGTYPDDGYPRVDQPTDGWGSFSKSAASPATAEVHVYSPINDSVGRITLYCPGITTTTTTTTSIVIESSTVLFNTDDSPSNVYAYYPDTANSVLLDVPSVGGYKVDVAHTSNKLWLTTSYIPTEWNIILSPFSSTYNRTISGGSFSSAGLGAIDDVTLIGVSGETVYEIDVTSNPAINTTKFSLISGRTVSGDYMLTTTGKFIVTTYTTGPFKTYITQYDYSTGAIEVDIEITSTISYPYGIYEYDGNIFIATFPGDIYMIDKYPPYTLTLVDTVGYNINGASQLPSYLTEHFYTYTTTTTTTSGVEATTTTTTTAP